MNERKKEWKSTCNYLVTGEHNRFR